MTRRFLLASVAGAAGARRRDDNYEFYHNLIEFDKRYIKFLNTLCGWKDGELNSPCNANKGRLDYKQFDRVVDAACDWMGLVRKEE
jgi:hypothetical protein